jgi:ATP-binding cassette subfamily B protein
LRDKPTQAGWRLLADTCRAQWKGLAAGVFVGLLWSGGKVAGPLLVQRAIDHGVTPSHGALGGWVVLLLVAGLVAAVFTGARRWFAFREARWAETVLRDRLFAHLQRLHFAFHDEAQTGQLMSRASNDLQQVQAFVVMIPMTISNLGTVLAVAVILVRLDPVLALLALGPLPLVNVLAKQFSGRLFPQVRRVQAESADLASVVEETVSGVRVVKGFGAEGVQSARLRAEAVDVYDASMGMAFVRSRYLPVIDLLPSIGLVAVLGYGGHQVLNGHLTVGQLVAFNSYVTLLIWPLRNMGQLVSLAQRAAASCLRVHEVLATEPLIADRPGSRALPPRGSHPVGELVFTDVVFGYGRTEPVLDHFTLRVRPGESVALVGTTGAGKTTVARLIPRFYDVEAGAITLDGVDVRDVRLHDLRGAIGIVFEDTFLFNDSVAANIAFAHPDAPMPSIERAARLSGADEFITALPEGYDTVLGERGYSLSGGQRQRIAIARAILADPRVLILDDATSAVDPTKEHEIRDALTEVMAGRTTIVIAHRPATIALADRVVLIADGRVAAEGTHDALLAESEAYRSVLAAGERSRWARLTAPGDGEVA